LISQEEVDLIQEIWAREVAGHANAKPMNVREIRKGK
jgi:hypothetical protein